MIPTNTSLPHPDNVGTIKNLKVYLCFSIDICLSRFTIDFLNLVNVWNGALSTKRLWGGWILNPDQLMQIHYNELLITQHQNVI